MREDLSIKYTYDWLNTTYGRLELSDSELFSKRRLIIDLLIEEYTEFVFGSTLDDKINALADIKVVASNYPFYMGKNYNEVHFDYSSYDYSDKTDDELMNLFVSIFTVLTQFGSASISSNLFYKLILEIISITDRIGYMIGNSDYELIDLEDQATYKSNMTKFDRTLEDAEESVRLYGIGEHPNKMGSVIDAMYEETGNDEWKYRILRTDGKILKSLNFKDVEEFKR